MTNETNARPPDEATDVIVHPFFYLSTGNTRWTVWLGENQGAAFATWEAARDYALALGAEHERPVWLFHGHRPMERLDDAQ